jgi:hypothetical protein
MTQTTPTPVQDRAERVRAVREAVTVNGIEYVEIVSANQRTLDLVFVHPLPGEAGALPASMDPLRPEQIEISGGVRVTGIQVTALNVSGRTLRVTVDRAGDFSIYQLALCAAPGSSAPPAGIDPVLARIEVNFKVSCPSQQDCIAPAAEEEPPPTVPIDYLAKDWSSFRRVMLDRMANTAPEWTERAGADAMVATVEALAWAADRLSYMQDAVATEAYLGTARRRVSLRRHAKLLDYAVHEGTNARSWIAFGVTAASAADGATLARGTQVAALGAGAAPVIAPADAARVLGAGTVFETLHEIRLEAARSTIALHSWSGAFNCLPRGSTAATLVRTAGLTLAPGDVVILEQSADPDTGLAADRDTALRAAVRLTEVTVAIDPLDNTDLLSIRWRAEDALPFDLPLEAEALIGGTPTLVSTARVLANVVLADHGRSFTGAPGLIPPAPIAGQTFRPQLERADVVFAEPFDAAGAEALPASALLRQDARRALPALYLTGPGGTWRPQRSLLGADRFSREFVLEPEPGQRPSLRFGDDVQGLRPAVGTTLTASYRVGGGPSGNVGADVLGSVVAALSGISWVRNPLPARGGTARESAEEIRRYAPRAFRTQDRAVTVADWVSHAEAFPEVSRAQAQLRWTGSWYTVFLTIDRADGRPVRGDADFTRRLLTYLDHYRIAGYDLDLRDPVFLPLDIELLVCLEPGYSAGDLRTRLLDVFSSGFRADGAPGVFHPDNFSFGDPLYLSRVYAAAMALDGVASVQPITFHPRGRVASGEIAAGVIRVNASDILRCDSDPNRPEYGAINFDIRETT